MLIVTVVLGVVILQNTEPVRVHFFWWNGEISAVLLLFLTTVGGFILGLLTTLLVWTRTRTRKKRRKQP